MELPTYTSIWRIEKRLYKLYDFRLPMPVPVGQIAVFAAITVPYVVLLTVLGLPFNHTLFWLYVLPPGVLTWLATRPVLESKRLPELVISQVRYLGEPSTWCRMAPLAEKDEIAVVGRVWRREKDLERSTSTEPQAEPQTAPGRPRPGVVAQPARSAATTGRSATPPAWAAAASAATERPAARTGRPAGRAVPGKIRATAPAPGAAARAAGRPANTPMAVSAAPPSPPVLPGRLVPPGEKAPASRPVPSAEVPPAARVRSADVWPAKVRPAAGIPPATEVRPVAGIPSAAGAGRALKRRPPVTCGPLARTG